MPTWPRADVPPVRRARHGLLRGAIAALALGCCAVLGGAGAAPRAAGGVGGVPGGGGAMVYKHMGVASCASSVCHGKISAQKDRNVGLYEYTIWSRDDRHSQAFNRLKSPLALQIGAKLDIANPSNAKLCVDCHADAVGAAQAGAKFKLTDGVGCEACHGGAERWIESHAQPSATHKDNVARGMYPTELPLQRAALCLSCHLGTRDKFATHEIMGAGHPRLSFELETFTANQPAHYVVDADYVARKGKIDGMNLWVTGQIESAERFLTLLQSNLLMPGGMIPELAFYDCFACHHPTDNVRWSKLRAGPGIKPGTLRLQKQNLLMLQAVAEAVAPDRLAELGAGTDNLIRAGQTDPAALRAAAQQLLDLLRGDEAWSTRVYSAADIAKVRKILLRMAAEDKASDFVVAEQIMYGLDSLSHSLDDYDKRRASLDVMYGKVTSGANFNAAQFADAARRVQGQF
jgi:hypothetical protein